jgi:hypothetical protein
MSVDNQSFIEQQKQVSLRLKTLYDSIKFIEDRDEMIKLLKEKEDDDNAVSQWLACMSRALIGGNNIYECSLEIMKYYYLLNFSEEMFDVDDVYENHDIFPLRFFEICVNNINLLKEQGEDRKSDRWRISVQEINGQYNNLRAKIEN